MPNSLLINIFLFNTSSWAIDNDSSIELEPIQIEAYRQNRQQTHQADDCSHSFSIDRVFSEKLEEESTADVKQAIKALPNVHIVEQGAFIKEVKIRGLSGDRIQSVINGVRISNHGSTHGGGGELNLIDISGVDSIEVTKGSPAVIYAPGAAGGVINVNLKSLPEEDSAKAGYTYSYDDGYEKTKHSSSFSGSWKGFGARVIYSETDANDYKVKNQSKLDAAILRTNEMDQREDTEHELKNLGYNDQSWQTQAQYLFNDHHKLYYKYGDYKGNDIVFTHGATTSQVFLYDFFNRRSHVAGYQLNDVGVLDQLSFSYSNQLITQGAFQGGSIHETALESDSFQLKALSHLGTSIDLTLGAEFSQDQADTLTLADQDYYAGYFNIDYVWQDWSFSVGLRSNSWTAKQGVVDNHNPALASEFEDHALTYAFGMIYNVASHNNLSFNYSRTFRFPSLYERFTSDFFVGGGAELKAEKGHNFEWSWKYHNASWFARVSLFYSQFEDFLGTVPRQKLINPAGLASCVETGRCNPATCEYDGRENEFFLSRLRFENLGEVSNKGFEVNMGIIVDDDYEAGFSFGLNDIDADNVFAQIDSNPLEFNAHLKKIFSSVPLKPWLKFNARYVTDWPKIIQEEGFAPFFTLDAYLGVRYEYAKKINFAVNFGIRNITDDVYHEAFSALDGVERSVFGNVSLKIKF